MRLGCAWVSNDRVRIAGRNWVCDGVRMRVAGARLAIGNLVSKLADTHGARNARRKAAAKFSIKRCAVVGAGGCGTR